MPSTGIGTPFAVVDLGWLRLLEAGPIRDRALPDARDDGRDLLRQPAMTRGVFRTLSVKIEMEFDGRRIPVMHGPLDDGRCARVIRPARLATRGRADGGDGREIGFRRRRRIGRYAMEQA